METQTIVAALIILTAFGYIGSLFWKKIGAFSPKKSCGADCGCEAKSKNS